MPSDLGRRKLVDIRDNIRFAQELLGSMSIEEFKANKATFYAITRALEIISEASRRLDPETKLRLAVMPWKDIAGSGNVYRHDYEKVMEEFVWATVVNALPPLLAAVESELSR